jgi:hypothetical protein
MFKIATSKGSRCKGGESSIVPSNVDGEVKVGNSCGGSKEIRWRTSFFVDIQSSMEIAPSPFVTVPFGHLSKF